MDLPPINAAVLTLALITLLLPTSLVLSSSRFAPTDNYLIDCGSPTPTTLDLANRVFVTDHAQITYSFRLLSSHTSTLADPSPNSSPILRTARVFNSASSYRFSIKEHGTHIVRLHFLDRFDLPSRPQFRVYAGEFQLIGDGVESKSNPNPVVKEFFVWAGGDELEIRFVPVRGSFAYVNAIEVVSAPSDLIVDFASLVGGGEAKFQGLTGLALETLYRVNVGGPKVTPFNDSLWRTWLPDDAYLMSEDVNIRKVHSSGPIKFQEGGASREVAPDNVYNTARVITSEKAAAIPKLNITWTFPVVEGYHYLVRLHFCDIASMALYMLRFNVYVNGYLAYENLDLSSATLQLASPYYADFVVKGCGLNEVTVSIGPSNMSRLQSVDAILNGIEIMKMSNSMKSLDGVFGMGGKGSIQGGICNALPMVAVICLLVLVSMFIKRKLATLKDSTSWLPLSLGRFNGGLKYSNIPLAEKF